jgi:DNA polymerase-3 subunit delta'
MPWPLTGNDLAVQILDRSVGSGDLPNAYLFAGPEQTGRRTAALLLAEAVNCTAANSPCGECDQCRRIAQGKHADIHLVTLEEAEEGPAHKDISVAQIREVETAAALSPYEGRTRVVIIDPAELLTMHAQNAFLKTLEEPPPRLLMVLIAADESRLLETVRSRCARVAFRLVPASVIEAALQSRGADGAQARLLSRLSGGRPGWAIAALNDPGFLKAREEVLDTARALPGMPFPDRVDLAERMSETFRRDRQRVYERLGGWLGWWRDVVLVQSGAEDAVANIDRPTELRTDAARWPRLSVLTFVRSLIEARDNLGANAQSKIALEALMLDVPSEGGQADAAARG